MKHKNKNLTEVIITAAICVVVIAANTSKTRAASEETATPTAAAKSASASQSRPAVAPQTLNVASQQTRTIDAEEKPGDTQQTLGPRSSTGLLICVAVLSLFIIGTPPGERRDVLRMKSPAI
jgi:hypothetical protein